jgi:hypothetical protein
MGVKSGRRVGLTTLPPSMNRMSENMGASTSRNPKGLHGLLLGKLYLGNWIIMNCNWIPGEECLGGGGVISGRLHEMSAKK